MKINKMEEPIANKTDRQWFAIAFHKKIDKNQKSDEEIAKLALDEWDILTTEEKLPFVQQAELDRQLHREKIQYFACYNKKDKSGRTLFFLDEIASKFGSQDNISFEAFQKVYNEMQNKWINTSNEDAQKYYQKARSPNVVARIRERLINKNLKAIQSINR